MNLTEKMLLLWPVNIDVVRLNCEVDDSGWYEWMLMRWSSEPEARRRPDVDQLRVVSCYRDVCTGCGYLKAFTHPLCPSSSLTMSMFSIHCLSP